MKVKLEKTYVAKDMPQIEVRVIDVTKNSDDKHWVQISGEQGVSEIRQDLFLEKFITKKEYHKSHLKRKENILAWAEPKELLKPENAITQLAKLTEEVGELAQAILKGNKNGQKDALGDIRVVIAILANQLGFDIDECEQFAYDVIVNRTGKTINGTFVKQEDL
jgi:NTP pyrophosphatase (non-canonical NTP hydrolase)